MAERAADRVKAASLRNRPRLTLDQKRWLDAYTTRTALAKARALPELAAANDSTASPSSSSPRATFVQSTQQPSGHVDPSAHTWTPTVPKPANDEQAPPPGASPPPTEGAPIVDGAPPQGDPAAAAMAAAIVGYIVLAGCGAANELLADKPIPDAIRVILANEATHQKIAGEVALAAQRLAIKHNVQSLPYQDELVVCGALVGSVLCYGAVLKRKSAAPKQPKVTNGVNHAEPEKTSTEDDTPTTKPPVPGLWS